MKRLEIRDVVTDLTGLIDRVHSGETFVLTSTYARRAVAVIAPADEHTPGKRVNFSAIGKGFERLVANAGRGESVVIAVRRKPMVRLEPLTWTGDQPEPVRDPVMWAQVMKAVDKRFNASQRRDLSPAQEEAAHLLASKVAYGMIAACAAYGFAPRDMEFDPCEHALWMALARVR
ncbi:hypothetical protein [Glycomyces sp. YM15]|uniref:hypothetical protein n=1 Tax=Glycomyces sp. YM15 TaxID=2800446 RepID=UPI0019660DB2|nr:hypothetical protein [Glycomyces sp. YM15]